MKSNNEGIKEVVNNKCIIDGLFIIMMINKEIRLNLLI